MSDYNFEQLSPHDLEILTRDLLQADWGVVLESFKTGKDGGIDLRYVSLNDNTIIQCKHYVRTGLTGLLRDLKVEATKVQQLQPDRYVLVTSVPLSPDNKKSIIETIGPAVLRVGDVYGRDDLNNLLGLHPEIEGRHFKLWLASRAVLDRVLHNAIVTQSEFKARQVYLEARRYVESEAYHHASTMLRNEGLVILAGPPGVGKTTLANLLLYDHLEKGYQAVLIQRDIEEGQKLFQDGIQQVFYFDDFLGTTFLGDRAIAIDGNNDRALLEFIAMVRATPEARLILTTREHIYSQAIDKSERLRQSDMDDLRVFLRIPNYTFSQRARILYNHIYFSDLPYGHQDELLRNNFYMEIIKHEKFNPRIIEWLSSFRRLRNISVEKYRSFVQGLLSDPSEIWRHAYEREISDAGRSMLLTLFSLGGQAEGNILKNAFVALHAERSLRYTFRTRPEDFRSALREVAGAFIKPWSMHGFEFLDPSVLDLLNKVVSEVPDNAVDIAAGSASFEQIERIWIFSQTEKNMAVKSALILQVERLKSSVERRMLDDRRISLGNGAFGFRGTTFERRLAIVMEMADRMPSDGFSAMVGALFDRAQKEWATEGVSINGVVYALRVLDGTHSTSAEEISSRKAILKSLLLAEISNGCRSDELREIILVLKDSDEADDPVVAAARVAFEKYAESSFTDELYDCGSAQQFEGLMDDLCFFRGELNVNINSLLERVEQAQTEYEMEKNEYSDHMAEEWRERSRDDLADAEDVSDMFGSLKDDRL